MGDSTDSGRPFVPWGFNYDRDYKMRLIEEYWDKEWNTVAAIMDAARGAGITKTNFLQKR